MSRARAGPTSPTKDRFEFYNYESQQVLKASPITARGLPEFGTAVLINVLNQAGALPSRNLGGEIKDYRKGAERYSNW